jgi:Glutamine amidotransferase domain
MCKLAAITATPSQTLKKSTAEDVITAAHHAIAKTERHGFGFAQAGANGLRARFVNPEDFRGLDALPAFGKRAGVMVQGFKVAGTAAQGGAYRPDRAVIMHGRTATCGISLRNTHPFRLHGWTLAHNGVVDWAGAEDPARAAAVSCDSEHLLFCIANAKTLDAAKAELENITGYAAFMALSPTGRLIVARDDRATLFAGITSRGRWIFGTTKAIVDAQADAIGAKGVTPYELDAWTWLDFAPGGDVELSTWKHGHATAAQIGFSQASLGKAWSPGAGETRRHKSRRAYGSPGLLSAGAWDGAGADWEM